MLVAPCAPLIVPGTIPFQSVLQARALGDKLSATPLLCDLFSSSGAARALTVLSLQVSYDRALDLWSSTLPGQQQRLADGPIPITTG